VYRGARAAVTRRCHAVGAHPHLPGQAAAPPERPAHLAAAGPGRAGAAAAAGARLLAGPQRLARGLHLAVRVLGERLAHAAADVRQVALDRRERRPAAAKGARRHLRCCARRQQRRGRQGQGSAQVAPGRHGARRAHPQRRCSPDRTHSSSVTRCVAISSLIPGLRQARGYCNSSLWITKHNRGRRRSGQSAGCGPLSIHSDRSDSQRQGLTLAPAQAAP